MPHSTTRPKRSRRSDARLGQSPRDEGIRVNAVCPGPTYTPFCEGRTAAAGRDDDDFKIEFAQRTMLKRPAVPREIAARVLLTGIRRRLVRHGLLSPSSRI